MEVDFMANRAGQMIRTLVGLGIFLLFLGVKLDANAAPVTMPDGGIFDAEYYAQNNPDVVAILGTDANVLYQHYLTSGRLEGRKPYADTAQAGAVAAAGAYVTLPDGTLFDAAYYAAANPDVAAVLGTDAAILAQHYVSSGKLEGRKPNAGTASVTIPAQQPQPTQVIPQQQAQPVQQTIETPKPAQNQSVTYVLNTNTRKFHYPGCRSVGQIKPNHRVDSHDSRAEIVRAGYSPCGNCHP